VLQGAVNARCDAKTRPEAAALLAQARDFYVASQGGSVSTTPLLLYYAFLNLAKTFILTSGCATSVVDARHGLGELRRQAADELTGADIVVVDDPNRQNVFPLLIRALGFPIPPNGTRIPVLET
jgi:hypothetical protein